MTAWLAAECDYTGTNEPKLVAVRLNNADNVLGPLQFDNNINTNPQISSEITLLSHNGSVVTLGNVIVLPFNNDSFLYIRPLYVTAASNGGTAFPQLQEVIVGDQSNVQQGTSFSAALQTLLGTTQPIPGLNNRRDDDAHALAVPVDLAHGVAEPRRDPDAGDRAARSSSRSSRSTARSSPTTRPRKQPSWRATSPLYGADEAKVQADLQALQKLLAQQAAPSPSP